MTFGEPDLLWLLALAPLAVLIGAWVWRRRLRALSAWASSGLWERLELRFHRGRLWLSLGLLGLAVTGVALALAEPRWGSQQQRVERQGVDVVFVLDSSLSMEARDVPPSRMDIAKTLVRRMVAALPGHRVGLVQAEGERVVLAPLTVDAAVIDLVMDTVSSGSLPNPGTRLAPAVRDSLELYPPESERHRVLVLLSDGEDHGGGWEPVVDRFRERHVVVHAIGIGTEKGAPIPIPGGNENQYKQDKNGQVVVSRLGREQLVDLAESTGGLYLEVDRASVGPTPILEAIESMKKRTLEGEIVNLQAERFQWPLGLAALALALQLFVTPFGAKP